MFKNYIMGDDPDHQVRKILVLPTDTEVQGHESATEQLAGFTAFMDSKTADYKEVLAQNSAAVFAVNYVQNRFILSEFSVPIARLWEAMGVRNLAEFSKALEAMKGDAETAGIVESFESQIKQYDELLAQIDKDLDAKIGPSTMSPEAGGEELPELGVQSRTITHYVQGSPFEMVLVVIVRTFSNPEVAQHILELYNKIHDFHRLGCDVFLLTRGPPIGTRGGSYIKLIGVPFRKLYDEAEATEELKAHRRNAVQLAGWDALTKVVEVSLIDEARQTPAPEESLSAQEDQTAYLTQKGGTILVNRSGKILYKFIESEGCSWPTVETIVNEVKKMGPSDSHNGPKPGANKVQSEISVQEKAAAQQTADAAKDEPKKCCVIL